MALMKNERSRSLEEVSASGKRAAEWFIKLEVEKNASEDEQIEFINWLCEDPENEMLYERCKLTWSISEELDDDPEIDHLIKTAAIEHSDTSPQRLFGFNVSVLKTAAAGLAIFILSTLLALNYWPADKALSVPQLSYHTATGEQKIITLADGSTILLNTSTEVTVEYNSEVRRVILERGEALFEVVGNPKRPFVVVAGKGKVRAIGTLFSVYKQRDQVNVVLADGSVVVEQLGDKGGVDQGRKLLMPGEKVSYSSEGNIGEVLLADLEKDIQWSKGKLTFSDVRLSEVIEEVNRYTVTKIVIDEGSIGEEKVTAYFNVDNVDDFLYALNKTLNISVHHDSGMIYLRKLSQAKN